MGIMTLGIIPVNPGYSELLGDLCLKSPEPEGFTVQHGELSATGAAESVWVFQEDEIRWIFGEKKCQKKSG